jgi:large subunit ribosomal protein L10
LAISKDKKVEMVADYADQLSRSQAMILTDYRGLTVAEITRLRQNLREVDGSFRVVKNTLFALALENAGVPVPTEQLAGPLAVGYCYGEVPPVAKALTDFAREADELTIKGAILGTSLLDAEGVKGLADPPPREVLLAQLLGAVQGPMSNLVTTIAAPMREIAQVLKSRSEQGQEAAA